MLNFGLKETSSNRQRERDGEGKSDGGRQDFIYID